MITLRIRISLIVVALTFMGCKDSEKSKTTASDTTIVTEDSLTTPENILLEKTIEAHGGDLYKTANYSFRFREKEYTFAHNGEEYLYTVESAINGDTLIDVIKNGEFSRYMDDQSIELSKEDVLKYSEALNSVIYFATLPHKLRDAAVNKTYKGTTTIKGKAYEVLEVTFDREGGGTDFDDVFYYWINAKNHKIDYLAYSYSVNNGGVRFRSAYNRRVVSGITFQDYINYKAPLETPLNDLPVLFEKGELEELSKIETENIININI